MQKIKLDCVKNKTGLCKNKTGLWKNKTGLWKNRTGLWKNKTGLWKIKLDCEPPGPSYKSVSFDLPNYWACMQ